MRIGVPKETADGERRVALVPEVVGKLVRGSAGDDASVLEVVVERGAGAGALIPDQAYADAGGELVDDAAAAFDADVVVKVAAPSEQEIGRLRSDATLIGFLGPLTNGEGVRAIADAGVTSFAMEAIPRISRAQSMDALSSQANISGYRSALIGAQELGRFFPMLMTAAGTIRPATVLVLGAGVAGLQAIATARRLGAVVQGFDVRSAVKEQVESLGAKFLEFDLGGDLEGAGGYAKELTAEQQARQQELMAEAIGKVDVVVTTALVPGRRAPILVTEEAVKLMKPGSVIVDLAGEAGGNCELSEPGESVIRHDVKILAPLNVPSTMAEHASQLYARNIQALLGLMVSDAGELSLDFEDEVIAGACITRGGEIVHEGARRAAGEQEATGA
ncbi:MAG TPA: Re/Si-specific NAD(P)(+) transhydrogenase subunit alpha [Solirubrobacteraceae bacterium]|nr:Re/Si-specific NAD(P)(+) transhydrogenase subunit alpha [Solirubrobacteraceae bacterium]